MPDDITEEDLTSDIAESIEDAVSLLEDAVDEVSSPVWAIDLDRDNRKDILIYKENGDHMVYVSLRFTILGVVSGSFAIYAWMCGWLDTLPFL